MGRAAVKIRSKKLRSAVEAEPIMPYTEAPGEHGERGGKLFVSKSGPRKVTNVRGIGTPAPTRARKR